MFREHVAVGALVAAIVVVVTYLYAALTDPLLLLLLFGVTIVGSFLPDVDSDGSLPFYFVFGSMTAATTGVVLLYTIQYAGGDWRYLIGVPAVALLFFWFVVGTMVKKMTHHRGIYHSLPALVIAALGTVLLVRWYGLLESVALMFGLAMAVGFATHLILDELHAGITLDGSPFTPKKSFGTATKMFVDSNAVNIATYTLLAVLTYNVLQ